MAKDFATLPEVAAPADKRSAGLRHVLQNVFADASAAAVASHLAAGRSVSGVLHGVAVTIVPDTKPDRA